MTTILSGSAAKFTVTVKSDGVPISLSGSIDASLRSADGAVELIPPFPLNEAHEMADWPAGVAGVDLTNVQTTGLLKGDAMLYLTGGFGVKRFGVEVETLELGTRSSLFIKDIVVEELRRDRLILAAEGMIDDLNLSDSYLWDKVLAAEAAIRDTLRVPLVPTRFFPLKPTQAQIDELGDMAWAVDPAYDYQPDMFRFEKWGYFLTRQKPIIEIHRMHFAYPSQDNNFFDVPLDWIRIDAKYGHVRLVPSSPALYTTMNAFIMTALAGSRSIPFMIQLEYTAGLENAARDYPQLIDAIKKKAVVKILTDLFLPQSGSISADGLSQSESIDVSKYEDSIDHIINGPPGANGGLMAKIHGIRVMVM